MWIHNPELSSKKTLDLQNSQKKIFLKTHHFGSSKIGDEKESTEKNSF